MLNYAYLVDNSWWKVNSNYNIGWKVYLYEYSLIEPVLSSRSYYELPK